ncbi:MAG TPA: primosomal protein N' [Bacillota bacterium]|nr:primosomal protein N' [Bacillota bacterium]
MIAAVILRECVWATNKIYEYLVPNDLEADIRRGQFVSVPFGKGNKQTIALVYALRMKAEAADTIVLKAVNSIVDPVPVLNDEQIRLVEFISRRYSCTYGDAIRLMVPRNAAAIHGRDQMVVSLVSEEAAMEAIEGVTVDNVTHIRILEWLLENDDAPLSSLMDAFSVSRSPFTTLAKKGLIRIEKRKVIRDNAVFDEPIDTEIVTPTYTPNTEQVKAIDSILHDPEHSMFLLYGITGSGKTEVYLQAASKILEEGGSVLYLVPEISLTPQTVKRIQERFDDTIAILHSRLTICERYAQWKRIREGSARIVIGARSAVFAPLVNLKLIIMDEEQDSSYKSETHPRYHTRDIATFRAMTQGARIVFGSATPCIETYYAAVNNRIKLLKLSNRATKQSLPNVHIVDMGKELNAGNASVFSRALYASMSSALENQEQVMLFLNRRGYSTSLICGSCGESIQCPRCDLDMTIHQQKTGNREVLICHFCGYVLPVDTKCPSCESTLQKRVGMGTEKLEEWVKHDFPNARVLRMDQDTTASRGAHARILDAFRNHEADILIGTQMIAKGHDFPSVSVVGILSADSLLHSGELRGRERAFQLLTQAAGRAGRGDKKGEVFFQSFSTKEEILNMAAKQDYPAFYRSEIAFRKDLGYPPFQALGTVTVCHINETTAREHASMMAASLRQMTEKVKDTCMVFGPCPAFIPRLRDRYRFQINIKAADTRMLSKIFTNISQTYATYQLFFEMDIDPL